MRHIRSCTAVTKGTVTKFIYRGEGNLAPVVSFEIDGKKYLKRRKFNGFKMVSRSGLPIPAKEDIWEDDKGYLAIRVGAVANMYDLAERIWPMGSEMDVYYHPKTQDQPCGKAHRSNSAAKDLFLYRFGVRDDSRCDVHRQQTGPVGLLVMFSSVIRWGTLALLRHSENWISRCSL